MRFTKFVFFKILNLAYIKLAQTAISYETSKK
jgi:hypothetical protein